MVICEITQENGQFKCLVSFSIGESTWDRVLEKVVPVMIRERWITNSKEEAIRTVIQYVKQVVEKDICEKDISIKLMASDPLAEKLRKYLECSV